MRVRVCVCVCVCVCACVQVDFNQGVVVLPTCVMRKLTRARVQSCVS